MSVFHSQGRSCLFLGVLAAMALLPGCKGGGEGMKTATGTTGGKASLYDQLGGEAAIKAVVDDFVARAASDPKVNFFRKGTAMEWKPTDEQLATFKKHLSQFITKATNGPGTYDGRDMKTVHAGMGITKDEFAAIAAQIPVFRVLHGDPR